MMIESSTYKEKQASIQGCDIMNGITIKELCDYISRGHEAEFRYKDSLYVKQPEVTDDKAYLVIWSCDKDGICICRYYILNQGIIAEDLIAKVLNEKCFDGKSFYEIKSDVTVKNIF